MHLYTLTMSILGLLLKSTKYYLYWDVEIANQKASFTRDTLVLLLIEVTSLAIKNLRLHYMILYF